MDKTIAGNNDSTLALPEAVNSSKRSLENNQDLEEDDSMRKETAKRIRLAFPKANDQFVKLFIGLSSDDRDEVEAALDELDDILEAEKQGDGATVAFMRLGGHVNLMNAMKKYRHCEEIQFHACNVTTQICFSRKIAALDDVGGLWGVAASFGAIGAFDRISECLEKFRRNEAVIDAALGSCNNLLSIAIEQNLDLFLESVRINMVVERMKDFSENESIQEKSCRILRFCIEDRTSSIELIKNAGAISVIGAVMDHYPAKSGAYKEAKKFMKVVLKI